MFVETLSSISAAVINQGRRRKLHWDGCPNFRIWIIRNQKKKFVKLVEVKKNIGGFCTDRISSSDYIDLKKETGKT